MIFILYYGATDDSKVADPGGHGDGRLRRDRDVPSRFLPAGKANRFAGHRRRRPHLHHAPAFRKLVAGRPSNRWGFHDTWAIGWPNFAPNSIFVADQDMAIGVTTYLQVAEIAKGHYRALADRCGRRGTCADTGARNSARWP